MSPNPSTKYNRAIIGMDGTQTTVDVYRVLRAFSPMDPEIQHAVKKLLCAGIRGKGDTVQDLNDAILSIQKALECISQERATVKFGPPPEGLCTTKRPSTELNPSEMMLPPASPVQEQEPAQTAGEIQLDVSSVQALEKPTIKCSRCTLYRGNLAGLSWCARRMPCSRNLEGFTPADSREVIR